MFTLLFTCLVFISNANLSCATSPTVWYLGNSDEVGLVATRDFFGFRESIINTTGQGNLFTTDFETIGECLDACSSSAYCIGVEFDPEVPSDPTYSLANTTFNRNGVCKWANEFDNVENALGPTAIELFAAPNGTWSLTNENTKCNGAGTPALKQVSLDLDQPTRESFEDANPAAEQFPNVRKYFAFNGEGACVPGATTDVSHAAQNHKNFVLDQCLSECVEGRAFGTCDIYRGEMVVLNNPQLGVFREDITACYVVDRRQYRDTCLDAVQNDPECGIEAMVKFIPKPIIARNAPTLTSDFLTRECHCSTSPLYPGIELSVPRNGKCKSKQAEMGTNIHLWSQPELRVTLAPTGAPTPGPTVAPTKSPTKSPTMEPSDEMVDLSNNNGLVAGIIGGVCLGAVLLGGLYVWRKNRNGDVSINSSSTLNMLALYKGGDGKNKKSMISFTAPSGLKSSSSWGKKVNGISLDRLESLGSESTESMGSGNSATASWDEQRKEQLKEQYLEDAERMSIFQNRPINSPHAREFSQKRVGSSASQFQSRVNAAPEAATDITNEFVDEVDGTTTSVRGSRLVSDRMSYMTENSSGRTVWSKASRRQPDLMQEDQEYVGQGSVRGSKSVNGDMSSVRSTSGRTVWSKASSKSSKKSKTNTIPEELDTMV